MKSHDQSNAYRKNCSANLRVLICNNGLAQLNLSNSGLIFSPEKQVNRVEMYQSVKVVSSYYSFSSTEADINPFKMMFPDSKKYVVY